jgi:sugar phosphate permease
MKMKTQSKLQKTVLFLRKNAGILLSATTILAILAVSLPHLQAGIARATGASDLVALLTGIMIDVGMISAEYAALTTKESNHTRIAMYIGLVLSALFNCLEFASASITLPAIAVLLTGLLLGISVPLMAYCNIQILFAQSRVGRARARATINSANVVQMKRIKK